MNIDKLTSSSLDISNVNSFFGDGADSWLKKLHKVTGLGGYESKIEGTWTVTKVVYYEGDEGLYRRDKRRNAHILKRNIEDSPAWR